MGRWFPGGRNRPRGLSLIVDDDDDDNDDDDDENVHKVLTYADEVVLIGDDVKAIEINADVLLNAFKDIGLTVNRENIYMEIGSNRSMIIIEDTTISSNSCERSLNIWTSIKNINSIEKKIKLYLKQEY